MASPSNAPSPTLTHASSEDSADLLSAYLDPAAFSETGSSIDTSLPFSGGSTEPRVVDCQQEPVSLGQQPFTFDPDGFWKEFGTGKSTHENQYSMSIDPASLFENASEPASAFGSSNGQPSPPASTPSEHCNSNQDIQQTSPKRMTTRKTSTGPARRTRSTASKQHRSVADLAMPMKETSNIQQKPQISAKMDEEDENQHNHRLPHIVFPVPDYIDRPSAEEYAKLSSKEKRQLRNKISARNFRHRRKEYITTLEEEIATRDGTISSMQEEMTSLKTENNTLRTDLEQLKKTVDELLNQARPTPMPLASSSTNHSNVLTPNLDKDKSGFASSFGPGGHHALGSLNVHTLFLPEPSPAAFAATAARRNINPRLNSLHPTQEDKAHLPGHSEDESFFGSNPYLLNGDHLDQYRASLYSKLTHNINGGKSNDLTHFQPSYFTSPAASSDPLKALSASQTSLPLSPTRTDGDVEQEVHSAVQAQTARVASLASTSLLTNMFRIFVNTFVGAEPAHVSDLLAGRATLQVAPSASSSQLDRLESRRSSLADVDTVERDLAALKVDDSRIATRRS